MYNRHLRLVVKPNELVTNPGISRNANRSVINNAACLSIPRSIHEHKLQIPNNIIIFVTLWKMILRHSRHVITHNILIHMRWCVFNSAFHKSNTICVNSIYTRSRHFLFDRFNACLFQSRFASYEFMTKQMSIIKRKQSLYDTHNIHIYTRWFV